jgi:hypothetical protein
MPVIGVVTTEQVPEIFGTVNVVTGQADDHPLGLIFPKGKPQIFEFCDEFARRNVHRMDIGSFVTCLAKFYRVVREEEFSIDTFPGNLEMAVRTLQIVGIFNGTVNGGPMLFSQGQVEV